MVSTRTEVPALRLVGIALVMVLSALVPALPHGEAQQSSLTILGGPYYTFDLPKRLPCQGQAVVMGHPGTDAVNDTQVQTVQIQSQGSGAITQVIFAYDLVADPGSASAPGFSKALLWNESRSGAAGWTAFADNNGTIAGKIHTLTFIASPGSQLASGPGVIFSIAFLVPKGVNGDKSGTPDSYPIRVSTTTVTATAGSFCIRMDNTPPKLLTAVTRDSDRDGRLDLIELTFNEPLDKDTLHVSEFKVQVKGAPKPYFILGTSPALSQAACGFNPETTVDPLKILQFTPTFGSSNPCYRRVILKMSPGPTFDTGELPNVTYPATTNGTLTDLAGNKLEPIALGGVNTTDGAKPVMVSALAKEGSTNVVVTFSEAVRGSGPPVGTPPAKPVYMDSDQCIGNCHSDFVYSDSCWPLPLNPPAGYQPCNPPPDPAGIGDCVGPDNGPSGTGMPPQIIGSTHNPSGANANQVILNLGAGSGTYSTRYPKNWQDASQPGWTQPAPGHDGCTNGQMGAGDTHRAFGDRLGLSLETSPPQNCVDATKKIYDFYPCDTIVKDVRGLRAVPYKQQVGNVIITGPYVNLAEVNIDSFRLTLKFNGPVTSAQGDTLGIQLDDLSIVSADDTGQGPSGIVAINHTAGSDEAILVLDHPTRPTDVDDTPARVRVNCASGKGIKAFGVKAVFVPCYDPDADQHPDVGMQDHTPPAFTPHGTTTPALTTVDADRNGYVDGIKVYFNEPIDDSSFCLGPATIARPLPPTVCAGDGFFDPDCQHQDTHSVLIVNNMPGPYTWDTDLLPDDDEGIIRFPETPGHLQNTGFTPALSTNPCWAAEGYGMDDPPNVPSPYIGTRRGTGLFADQYHPGPSTPPFLFANYMKRVCGEQFGKGGQSSAAGTLPACFPGATDDSEFGGITVKVNDGAPPALWSAKTIDTPEPGPHCGLSDASGCEGNGFLDGYVLTFSEPVNDCSFRADEWRVAGHTVTDMRTNVMKGGYNAICPPPRYPPQGQGNPVIVANFDDSISPDTDAKPELTYTGPSCNSCGMRDLNGNAMAAFGALAVNEEDNAPPVIYCVRGFVGQPDITVEFSEPVDNGDVSGSQGQNGARGGALTRDDFVYLNGDAFSGASGMSGTTPVQHTPGKRTATITLNAPLSNADIRNDTLAANFHSVFEVAPTVKLKQAASANPHHYCAGIDTVPPANVTGLQVVTGLTSANAVTLSWRASGNDDPCYGITSDTVYNGLLGADSDGDGIPDTCRSGDAHGNVTGYLIKVSINDITPANLDFKTGAGIVAVLVTTHATDPATCQASNGTAIANCDPECMSELSYTATGTNQGQLLLSMDPKPCALAQPGQVQRATITGLDADTTYHFAVVAFDNATDKDGVWRPNFSGMGPTNVTALTGKDKTPPTPAPVIFSSIRPYTANKDKRPLFQWSKATDPESAVTYAWALLSGDKDLDHVVSCKTDHIQSANETRPTQDLKPGTWTFHVAACSGGGQTQTAHYTILFGNPAIEPARIQNANEGIRTEPFILGEEYIVNWTLPSQAEIQQWVPGGELEGIQVWRMLCPQEGECARELMHEERGNYTSLRTGTWTDVNHTSDYQTEPSYRVEMVFATGQTQDQSSVRGFSGPRDITPHSSPLVPLLIVLLVALALAAGVTWFILRSRAKAAKIQMKEEAPAGIDPETGLPAHDVRCPSCQTPFQAVGTLPLQITCPNCGVSGMLQ